MRRTPIVEPNQSRAVEQAAGVAEDYFPNNK